MPKKSATTPEKPTIWDIHQQDILRWAYTTFNGHEGPPLPTDPFHPSFQQIRVLSSWSVLINSKRKAHWNQQHPEQQITLNEDEKAVVDKIGMSIQSGHGLAKTATLTLIALHFLQCFPQSRTIVTAPAGPQLFTVIWPELYKWININELTRTFWQWGAKQITLAGPDKGADHWLRPRTIDPKATADEQAETLAGLHGKQTLRVIDEASGVPDAVMLPFEGGLTDPVALIALGYNPTRNTGFAIETQRQYRERWLCHHLDAEELADYPPPWYNPKVQKDLAETYGRESNFYRVRVRGLPPLASPDTLIPWEWVMDATQREMEAMEYDPIVIGVDVAGEGTDRTIACIRQRHTVLELRERRGLDTMHVAFWVESVMADCTIAYPQSRILVGVDSIGIGKGVYDYLKIVKGYKDVFPINVARKMAPTDKFFTMRDRNYWWVREVFEKGDIAIPKDDGLIGELTAFRWTDENLEGKVRVEEKRKMRSRLPEGKNSPDKADALMMTEYIMRTMGKQEVIAAHEHRQRRWKHAKDISSWKVV